MIDNPEEHTTIETQDSKIFTIDMLPIADKNDKMSYISRLSLFTNLMAKDIKDLGIEKNSNGNSYKLPHYGFDVFKKNLTEIGIKLNVGRWTDITNFGNIAIELFQADSISVLGEKIFILTTDGQDFTGNFDEYVQKGLGALEATKENEKNKMKIAIQSENKYSLDNGILNIKANTQNLQIPADSYCIPSKDEKRVAVISENHLKYYSYDDTQYTAEKQAYDLSVYGEVKNIATDANNNFYFIISELNGISQLRILNRKTLEEVQKPYDDINEIIHMSHPSGKLFCKDTEGFLRVVIINTSTLERGYVDNETLTIEDNSPRVLKVQDTTTAALVEALNAGKIQLEDSELSSVESVSSDHAEIINTIWNLPTPGGETLFELFQGADDKQKIDQVLDFLLQIQKYSDVKRVAGVTREIETAIHKKRSVIELSLIEKDCQELVEKFEYNKTTIDFKQLLEIKGHVDSLISRRGQLLLKNNSIDDKISNVTNEINEFLEKFRDENTGETKNVFEKQLIAVEDFLQSISYIQHISSVYSEKDYAEAHKILDFFEIEEREKQENRLEGLIATRVTQLESEIKTQEALGKKEQQAKIHLIHQKISQVSIIIRRIEDTQTITEYQRVDPLILNIISEAEGIAKAEKDIILLKLENIFKERQQALRVNNLYSRGVTMSLDEYNIDTSLYYAESAEKETEFTLEGRRTADNEVLLSLHYDDGTIFDIDTYLQNPQKFSEGIAHAGVPEKMSLSDFHALQKKYNRWIKTGKNDLKNLAGNLSLELEKEERTKLLEKISTLKENFSDARLLELFANNLSHSLDLNPRAHLNLPNPKFIVLDEEREIFEKMSAGFSIQKNEQKGIEILEGDPGLGKTMLCEEFGAITNREVVRIQCAKMDPSEMFFAPQLKAGETSRQPAEWIKLMQKPGIILLFDEIDKLDEQCFERLHRLFDGGRSVYDPHLGNIKANADCLLVGTRNSYERLSNPIVSRSNIIQIHAPSEENEAYKIARMSGIDFLSDIGYDEFLQIYKGEGSMVPNLLGKNKSVDKPIGNIRSLVLIFRALREKQKSEDFNDTYMYEVSYRDAEQIFLRYQYYSGSDFSTVVKDVLTAKSRAVVRDFTDKNIQESIVSNIVETYIK